MQRKENFVGFDVLRAVAVRSDIHWDMTTCGAVEIYR
jgi:hypothetical protein